VDRVAPPYLSDHEAVSRSKLSAELLNYAAVQGFFGSHQARDQRHPHRLQQQGYQRTHQGIPRYLFSSWLGLSFFGERPIACRSVSST